MAEYVELYIDQGADFSTTIAINDDNTNTPQNVSGYIVTSQLRRSLVSPNATASFSCSIPYPQSGEIFIEMTAANTANIPAGKYFFDVLINDDGLYSRLVEGVIFVTPSITR
jgi:ABC-type branched-subunit amino acid transport system substrate-binding protein